MTDKYSIELTHYNDKSDGKEILIKSGYAEIFVNAEDKFHFMSVERLENALEYAKHLVKNITEEEALKTIDRTIGASHQASEPQSSFNVTDRPFGYENDKNETLNAIKGYLSTITNYQTHQEAFMSEINAMQKKADAKRFLIKNNPSKVAEDELEELLNEIKAKKLSYEESYTRNNGSITPETGAKIILAEIVNYLANQLQSKVPDGKDDSENVLFKGIDGGDCGDAYDGAPIRSFDFKPLSHDDIGVGLGMMNFEAAAEICGSRFTILLDDLCKLERALAAYMLDVANDAGFMEATCPSLVKPSALFGTGQLPKFGDDIFKIADDKDGKALVPTSEVTLTNLFANKHWQEAELPVKMASYSQCFRKEAGSAGRDTKGMFRQHQFGKVELVVGTVPTLEDSERAHMMMLNTVEKVLKGLELPYRIVTLCKGDTGFSSSLTYDFEVWVPSRGEYKEISSVSNCLNFQARRMKARFKAKDKASPMRKEKYIHTLNGSCVAIGRAIVAVLENHQNEDGSVTVPAVLRGYMGGLEVIKPNGKQKMFKR